MYVKFWK